TIGGHTWNHESWQSSCGYSVLDVWSEPGGPHNTDAPLNEQYVIPFLALDKTDAVDPEVAHCSDAGASDAGRSTDGSAPTSDGGGSSGSSGSSGGVSMAGGSGGAMGASSGGSGGSTGGTTGSDLDASALFDATPASADQGSARSNAGCACSIPRPNAGADLRALIPAGLGILLLWGRGRRKRSLAPATAGRGKAAGSP